MGNWKKGATKRRDERHTKLSDEPIQSLKPAKKKKDTRKWCRGKDGVEHKPECLKYNEVKHTGMKAFDHWRILVCSVCGKELATYICRGIKPNWVDK